MYSRSVSMYALTHHYVRRATVRNHRNCVEKCGAVPTVTNTLTNGRSSVVMIHIRSVSQRRPLCWQHLHRIDGVQESRTVKDRCYYFSTYIFLNSIFI